MSARACTNRLGSPSLGTMVILITEPHDDTRAWLLFLGDSREASDVLADCFEPLLKRSYLVGAPRTGRRPLSFVGPTFSLCAYGGCVQATTSQPKRRRGGRRSRRRCRARRGHRRLGSGSRVLADPAGLACVFRGTLSLLPSRLPAVAEGGDYNGGEY